jgi:hypothetical protein
MEHEKHSSEYPGDATLPDFDSTEHLFGSALKLFVENFREKYSGLQYFASSLQQIDEHFHKKDASLVPRTARLNIKGGGFRFQTSSDHRNVASLHHPAHWLNPGS